MNHGRSALQWILWILLLIIIVGGGFFWWNYRPIPTNELVQFDQRIVSTDKQKIAENYLQNKNTMGALDDIIKARGVALDDYKMVSVVLDKNQKLSTLSGYLVYNNLPVYTSGLFCAVAQINGFLYCDGESQFDSIKRISLSGEDIVPKISFNDAINIATVKNDLNFYTPKNNKGYTAELGVWQLPDNTYETVWNITSKNKIYTTEGTFIQVAIINASTGDIICPKGGITDVMGGHPSCLSF